MKCRIALVGDFSPAVVAHQAIPLALELAGAAESQIVEWEWVPTISIQDAARDFQGYNGVWLVPASPYASMTGALAALRWAREAKCPLLASCGGFQHLVIEFARNCAGITTADHTETNPTAEEAVVTGLACSLVGEIGSLRFVTGSHLRRSYGRDLAIEQYHCRYGVNTSYRMRLEGAGLRFSAFDDQGEMRAAELPEERHPFYVGTLFQSERAALRGEIPPLARALVLAAATPAALTA